MLALIAFGAVAGYLGLCTLLFFQQRAILYPAPPLAPEPKVPRGQWLRLPGGGAALWVPGNAGERTVVHFHGNGEQLADLGTLARVFGDAGLGFFAVEYPGYGLLQHLPPSEKALCDSAHAALQYLETKLGVSRDAMVLQGQSLGSGVAVELATRGYGGRLALLSPFTSIPDVAAEYYGWLPVRLLARDVFDNARKAPTLAVPVWVVHGDRDEVIPFRLGRRLSTLFPRARLLVVEGGGHNDLLARAEVLPELIAFAKGQGGP